MLRPQAKSPVIGHRSTRTFAPRPQRPKIAVRPRSAAPSGSVLMPSAESTARAREQSGRSQRRGSQPLHRSRGGWQPREKSLQRLTQNQIEECLLRYSPIALLDHFCVLPRCLHLQCLDASPCNAYACPRHSLWVLMGSLWIPYGLLWIPYGFPMDFYEFPMNFL